MKFTKVAASSEDPAYPAENLLKNTNGWRTNIEYLTGLALVKLEMEKAVTIESISVTNNGSAFIVVYVSDRDEDNTYIKFGERQIFAHLTNIFEGKCCDRTKVFHQNELTIGKKFKYIRIHCEKHFLKYIQFGIKSVKVQREMRMLHG